VTADTLCPWHTRWFFVCPADLLAEDGRHLTIDLPALSITLQNYRGTLSGFRNLCPRCGEPMRPAGRGEGALRCAAHGWTYDVDGRPVALPDDDALARLDATARKALALRPIAVAVIDGAVFARIDDDGSLPDARWLADAELAGATQRLSIERQLPAGAPPPATGSTIGNLSIELKGDFALLGWVVPQGPDAVTATVALYSLAEAPDEIPTDTRAAYDQAARALQAAAA
jgi:nitrite reductase/ring-hydroxylating ferredoxin subunit